MTMAGTSQIAIVILAGGQGLRIGGTKAQKMLDGHTLLSHALAKARTWSDMVAVSLREEKQAVGGADCQLLFDDPRIDGPLAGLASALAYATACRRTHVLTVACDTPFLPDNLSDRLVSEIGTCGAALAQCGERLQPLCSLWSCDAADELAAYVQSGRKALIGFAETIGYTPVIWPADEVCSFFNINTQHDLHTAEQRLCE